MFANGSNRKRQLDIQKRTIKSTTVTSPELSDGRVPDEKARRTQPSAVQLQPSKENHLSHGPAPLGSRRDRKVPSITPTPQAVDFGQDDTESEEDDASTPKRVKHDNGEGRDPMRQIRCKDAFGLHAGIETSVAHAADIPALDKGTRYESAVPGLATPLELELQYPSSMRCERYRLIKPIHDPHAFQAVSDITEVMHKVSEHFLPDSARLAFEDESTGFPQRFQRAVNKHSIDGIKGVIREYNAILTKLRDDGSIANVLDQRHSLHPALVERVLNQTYSRTVSPNLRVLRKYQAGTDNVYGELLPKFISTILTRDLQLTSKEILVDLGSGVGNVVLQAALEVGCESWGCEMMTEYCRVADLQHAEFVARCRLWGLALGKVYLEKGDFLENPAIRKILKRADAVLVNNQVFTPGLNEALTNLFLDLKEGCRVVSLKSFVPSEHKITPRNLNSSYNVLSVEKKRYYSSCVSWTNEGGSYYISTKDSKRIEHFLKR